jgi:FtsP/CotA-like multicopper oxidase with cupredoxin domain
MPTLTFTEGDTAEIYVHNLLKSPTSVHWHWVILPINLMVCLISHKCLFNRRNSFNKFPVIQNGTYWYHSHSELQEQIGMYGALIFLKKNEPEIKQYPVVLSDWSNENPTGTSQSA